MTLIRTSYIQHSNVFATETRILNIMHQLHLKLISNQKSLRCDFYSNKISFLHIYYELHAHE